MKKKVIISSIVAAVLLISAVIGVVIIRKNNAKVKMSTRDIYAMSAASSVAYLSENDGAASAGFSGGANSSPVLPVASKPTNITDGFTTGIYNCLTMFDGIVLGGGIDQSIKENTATDEVLKNYKLEMNISFPKGSGQTAVCTMYFNETETATEKEVEKGVEEIEVSTKFEGVIVYGDEKFVVKGVREVETEGNEKEYSIEFKTYKNSSQTGLVADEENYVIVEQSVENDEIEYEYVFYKDGAKVQDIELEYEQTRKGAEIEYQLKDTTNGTLNETVFKIKKGKNDNTFSVQIYVNKEKDTIKVEKQEDGTYKFIYSNDFSEVIPNNA